MVADARGRGVYELRAKPDSTEMDSLNVSETGIWTCCDANAFPTSALTLQGLGNTVAVYAMQKVTIHVEVFCACKSYQSL